LTEITADPTVTVGTIGGGAVEAGVVGDELASGALELSALPVVFFSYESILTL